MTEEWRKYEITATYLLDNFAGHFGLIRVEGKQKVLGLETKTKWEIEAKGIKVGPSEAFVIVECRRYKSSKQNQEKVAALAYRIIDTGAEGGIIVSPLGLQEGAAKIAAANKIIEVRLNADCTPEEFVMSFLGKLMVGVKETVKLGDLAVLSLTRNCRMCGTMFKPLGCETTCPKCLTDKLSSST
jgi:predicted Zn-ribbon and HTH transcriptional regulator